jgi:hypothetical protein
MRKQQSPLAKGCSIWSRPRDYRSRVCTCPSLALVTSRVMVTPTVMFRRLGRHCDAPKSIQLDTLAPGNTTAASSRSLHRKKTRQPWPDRVSTQGDVHRHSVRVRTGAQEREIEADQIIYPLGSYVDAENVPGAADFTYRLDPRNGSRAAAALPQERHKRAGDRLRILAVGGGRFP